MRHASAALVVLIGLMLSITGALLLLSVEHMPDIPSRCAHAAAGHVNMHIHVHARFCGASMWARTLQGT